MQRMFDNRNAMWRQFQQPGPLQGFIGSHLGGGPQPFPVQPNNPFQPRPFEGQSQNPKKVPIFGMPFQPRPFEGGSQFGGKGFWNQAQGLIPGQNHLMQMFGKKY